MSDSLTLPPGTLLADKFRIQRLLGAGAMGAVYAIQHELTRHRRALKLLHADVRSVPDLVRRFLNEASAAGRAGSAHLVETFDAGTLPSGEPYVVMELLEGETLTGLLERESPVAVGRAAELVAQAAEGIQAAHAAGIVHRDLKPDNLFVTTREGRPFVKILDFGVSKFRTASGAFASQTRAGVVCGSPAYMSGEQLMGKEDVDARTDVFALGVVLYQTLTGKLPFEAPTIEALAVRVVTGNSTPIESLRADLPPAMIEIVRRALLPDRDKRFPTAQAFAEALQPLRSDKRTADAAALALGETVVRPGESAVSSTTDLLAAGVPVPGRAARRAVIGLVTLAALSIGVALLRARASHDAAETPSPPPAKATAERLPPPESAARKTPTALVEASATLPAAGARDAARKAGKIQAHGAEPRKAFPESGPPPAAAPTPSTAETLGLHRDNPFR